MLELLLLLLVLAFLPNVIDGMFMVLLIVLNVLAGLVQYLVVPLCALFAFFYIVQYIVEFIS
jgi:hypothetical protein